MPIRYILFDAVGTLLYAEPCVADIYESVGRRFGSLLPAAEIAPRFASAYQRVFRNADNFSTNEGREWQRWQSVVADVFCAVPHATDAIFAELWQHFAEPWHWQLFDDVAATWHELSARGYVLGIASNFDARLRNILAGHEVLSGCPHVFVSTELGHAKPGAVFYHETERRLGARPEEILMVGDDWENDVVAPRCAGWNSVALVRGRERSEARSDGLFCLRDLLSYVE